MSSIAPSKTSTNTDYTLDEWTLNKVIEEGVQRVDTILIRVTIRDATRPGVTRPGVYTITRAIYDSFPKEEPARTQAAIKWMEEKVDETHYMWMQEAPPPPPSVSLSAAERAKLLTGNPKGEARKSIQTSLSKGEVPKGIREGEESELPQTSPFGDEFEGKPAREQGTSQRTDTPAAGGKP